MANNNKVTPLKQVMSLQQIRMLKDMCPDKNDPALKQEIQNILSQIQKEKETPRVFTIEKPEHPSKAYLTNPFPFLPFKIDRVLELWIMAEHKNFILENLGLCRVDSYLQRWDNRAVYTSLLRHLLNYTTVETMEIHPPTGASSLSAEVLAYMRTTFLGCAESVAIKNADDISGWPWFFSFDPSECTREAVMEYVKSRLDINLSVVQNINIYEMGILRAMAPFLIPKRLPTFAPLSFELAAEYVEYVFSLDQDLEPVLPGCPWCFDFSPEDCYPPRVRTWAEENGKTEMIKLEATMRMLAPYWAAGADPEKEPELDLSVAFESVESMDDQHKEMFPWCFPFPRSQCTREWIEKRVDDMPRKQLVLRAWAPHMQRATRPLDDFFPVVLTPETEVPKEHEHIYSVVSQRDRVDHLIRKTREAALGRKLLETEKWDLGSETDEELCVEPALMLHKALGLLKNPTEGILRLAPPPKLAELDKV